VLHHADEQETCCEHKHCRNDRTESHRQERDPEYNPHFKRVLDEANQFVHHLLRLPDINVVAVRFLDQLLLVLVQISDDIHLLLEISNTFVCEELAASLTFIFLYVVSF